MPPDPRHPRLELLWPGKYGPDGERTPISRCHPALALDERVPGAPDRPSGRLVLGDNLLALDGLLDSLEGQVDLVYIDPPFATGAEFSALRKFGDGEPGAAEQLRVPAFEDSWSGGPAGLLEMLDPRIRMIHRLLAPQGSLYVHVDPTMGHAVKLLLDDVMGEACFQREIVWRIGWLSGFKTMARNWIRNHDLIFFYTKDPKRFTFNKSWIPHADGYRRRDGKPPTGPGVPLEDVWNANAGEFALSGRASLDSIQIKSLSREKTGWATQKNESLLERIIQASSNPGDLVLDAFAGSGTTAAVAARTGRAFVACDRSPLAMFIARCRVLDVPERGHLEMCRVGAPLDEGAGVTEIHLEVEPHGDTVAVHLAGCDLAPASWPEPLRGRPWVDRVEAWAVDWSARDPFQTDFESHRSHHRRTLDVRTPPRRLVVPEPAVAVKVWDVLGRCTTRRFRLARSPDGSWRAL